MLRSAPKAGEESGPVREEPFKIEEIVLKRLAEVREGDRQFSFLRAFEPFVEELAHVGEQAKDQVAVRVLVEDVSVAVRFAPVPEIFAFEPFDGVRVPGFVQRHLEKQQARLLALHDMSGEKVVERKREVMPQFEFFGKSSRHLVLRFLRQ